MSIFISIASYRDPDLLNTVKSAWNNAAYNKSLFFSIVSQAEESEHPDLSFIPKNQIRYTKVHWKESFGACWAREIASRDINRYYFLQIDSHTRFKKDWDLTAIKSYIVCQNYCWGRNIVMSNYPPSYTIDWEKNEDLLVNWDKKFKLRAEWDEGSRMIQARWEECEFDDLGHESFFVSANNLFCEARFIRLVPYDKELYFTGEEPSLALRFYTRGIKIINTPIDFLHTNYDRDNGRRNFHWVDSTTWGELNRLSYKKLAKIMTGDLSLGVYGIGSIELFKEYQERTGIDLESKKSIIDPVFEPSVEHIKE